MTADHARHDLPRVARFAVGDAYPEEIAEAREQVARCTECAALADDIRLIAAHTSELPAATRTRDFRLTQADAERLRGSIFERLLRRLAAPGLGALRPVAGVAMAAGLALAMIGVLPQLQQASVTSFDDAQPSPMTELAPSGPAAAPTTDDNGRPGGANGQPEVNVPVGSAGEPVDQPVDANGHDTSASAAPAYAPTSAPAPPEDQGAPRAAESPVAAGSSDRNPPAQASRDALPALLVVGGVLIAAVGAVVLLLAWLARRRFADPLLR